MLRTEHKSSLTAETFCKQLLSQKYNTNLDCLVHHLRTTIVARKNDNFKCVHHLESFNKVVQLTILSLTVVLVNTHLFYVCVRECVLHH